MQGMFGPVTTPYLAIGVVSITYISAGSFLNSSLQRTYVPPKLGVSVSTDKDPDRAPYLCQTLSTESQSFLVS